MDFEAFIASAWDDHGDRPQEVADRLAVAVPGIASPEQVAPFARLVVHVMGEHLGHWARGIDILEALRRDPALAGSPAAVAAARRGVATLRYASGDTAVLPSFDADDRATVLASVAAIRTGRDDPDGALAAYAEAVTLAAALPAGSPAFRALAVAGNNLTVALEDLPHRTSAQTEGMVAAAHGGLAFWRVAGTWLEEERAHYRLARSLLAAGDPAQAVESGKRCAQVCLANDAPAFERFFAYAVLSRALRAAGRPADAADMREEALAWLERVPEDDRRWCEADLAALA